MDGIEEVDITSLTAEQMKNREGNVGGSEIASLFGCGYKTELQLWLEKAGRLEPERISGAHIEAGIFMEAGIAAWTSHRTGWNIRKVHRYTRHKQNPGWGASLDYEIVGHPDGPGVVQIKRVGFFAAKRDWLLDDDEALEAPIHIELQMQHELGAIGREWGAIAADVTGDDLKIITRRIDPRIQQEIADKLGAFWDSVKRDDPPEPDPDRDLATLTRLYPASVANKIFDVTRLDASAASDFLQYVQDLEQGRAYKKAGEAMEEAAKCAILWHIKDAEIVDLGVLHSEKPEIMTAKLTNRKGYVVEDTTYRVITSPKEKKEPKAPKEKKGKKDAKAEADPTPAAVEAADGGQVRGDDQPSD